jgi:hypothetical protein
MIYTCSAHCDGANGSMAKEVVFCQSFSSQGMGDNIKKQWRENQK